MLYVISDGAVVMESRVIVGKPETPTPELTSNLECLVTYPYWHVPRKIAVEEYLPIIQRDTSFLGRNNFDVLNRKGLLVHPDSVAWSTFSKNYFPVALRQREGTENSMGVVKFVFDNPYAVFLHDTNARRLFKNDIRAYSHGCVRVERAVELSHYLLTGDVQGHSGRFDRYLKEKLRHTIDFPSTFPIHIRYFTVAAKGYSLVFYKDLYGKDNSIIKAVYGDPNSMVGE
jgi:murein L,D-transpeptidase YcbB/YkuD